MAKKATRKKITPKKRTTTSSTRKGTKKPARSKKPTTKDDAPPLIDRLDEFQETGTGADVPATAPSTIDLRRPNPYGIEATGTLTDAEEPSKDLDTEIDSAEQEPRERSLIDKVKGALGFSGEDKTGDDEPL